jgi:phosphotransferase system enzyme I (PtsI)
MEIFKGKVSYKGVAIGKIAEMAKNEVVVRRSHVEDVEAEFARYMEAKTKAQEQLAKLGEHAAKEIGPAEAEVFEVHSMMLDDFDDQVEEIVKEQTLNAEFAVAETADNTKKML